MTVNDERRNGTAARPGGADDAGPPAGGPPGRAERQDTHPHVAGKDFPNHVEEDADRPSTYAPSSGASSGALPRQESVDAAPPPIDSPAFWISGISFMLVPVLLAAALIVPSGEVSLPTSTLCLVLALGFSLAAYMSALARSHAPTRAVAATRRKCQHALVKALVASIAAWSTLHVVFPNGFHVPVAYWEGCVMLGSIMLLLTFVSGDAASIEARANAQARGNPHADGNSGNGSPSSHGIEGT